MAKVTPSMAKNQMGRCFRAILDPYPTKKEVTDLWLEFESCCVYCGQKIDRASRTGHLDHVKPSSEGGNNNVHNFVLSCASCNGDEKREQNWESFLKQKAPNETVFIERKAMIQEWIDHTGCDEPTYDRGEVDLIIEKAITDFSLAVEKLKSLRKVDE